MNFGSKILSLAVLASTSLAVAQVPTGADLKKQIEEACNNATQKKLSELITQATNTPFKGYGDERKTEFDAEAIKQLVEAGANVCVNMSSDNSSHNWDTPINRVLSRAPFAKNSAEVLGTLLAKLPALDEKIQKTCYSSALVAASKNHRDNYTRNAAFVSDEVFQLLLSSKIAAADAEVFKEGLKSFIGNGNVARAEALVLAGANINDRFRGDEYKIHTTLLHTAVQSGKLEMVEFVLRESQRTAKPMTVNQGTAFDGKDEERRGISSDTLENETPLMVAVKRKDQALAEALIRDLKADVNAKKKYATRKGEFTGVTALTVAKKDLAAACADNTKTCKAQLALIDMLESYGAKDCTKDPCPVPEQ